MTSGQWTRETGKVFRTTVRMFYRWAAKSGRIESSPAEEFPSIRSGLPNPKPVPEEDFRNAVHATEYPYVTSAGETRTYHDPEIVRMAIRLAGELGLRRAEVAAVHRDHILETADGYELKVLGKGRKTRFLPLSVKFRDDLIAHIDARGGGFAFPSSALCGHLSSRWLGQLVRSALPPGYTMHKLRHRFATQMYRRGDLLMASELLGHSNLSTTQIYVLPDRSKHRSIMEGLGV